MSKCQTGVWKQVGYQNGWPRFTWPGGQCRSGNWGRWEGWVRRTWQVRRASQNDNGWVNLKVHRL